MFSRKVQYGWILLASLFVYASIVNAQNKSRKITDADLLNIVEKQTFEYFWSGAEPNSGLARERINMDGIYPENDKDIVTIGGSGFGVMALIAGIDRGYITRRQGVGRFERIVSFLEKVR